MFIAFYHTLANLKSFLILGVILVGVTSLTWIMHAITSGAAAKVESKYIAASLAENVKINAEQEEYYKTLLTRTGQVRDNLKVSEEEARRHKNKIIGLEKQLEEGTEICSLNCILPQLSLD